MSKVNITLSIDEEKLKAIEGYLKLENFSLQKKLDDVVNQLYEQVVPEEVRKFIDMTSGVKPKRPAAPQRKAPPKAPAQNTQKPTEETSHGRS